MFHIKYIAMYTVLVHAGAIRKLLHGFAFKLVDYLQFKYIRTDHTIMYAELVKKPDTFYLLQTRK